MKKAIVLLIVVSFFIVAAGCGNNMDQSSLEISDNVEFGEKDYEKIVSSNNGLGLTWLSEAEPNKDCNYFTYKFIYGFIDGV